MTFEQLLDDQRSHIEQVIHDLSRRHFLAPAEMEDFRAWSLRALERNDFELLRAFDGRSRWETYLTAVLTREFFLFQGVLWGQWRPSPAAHRMGPAAVLLEELVDRDGLPLEHAFDTMRDVHRVDLPLYRLEELADDLRLRAHPAVDDELSVAADRGAPPDVALGMALRRALMLLSPDDRLIIELRVRDQQPIARIARVMHMDPRPLQRRLTLAKNVIRASLLEQGVAHADVDSLLLHAEDPAHPHHKSWCTVLSGPAK